MTIKRYLGLAGLAVLSVGMLAACSTKEKSASGTKDTPKEVIFATVGTTAPFSFEKEGQLTGYDIEVAKAVFKDAEKYKLQFKKTEWSSIFTGLDSGKYQMGGNNISYTKERSAKYLFSYPIGATPSVLVVPKDSDIKSYDDIKGHSTQVVQGTTTAAQLKAFNEEHADNPVELKFTNETITQMLTNLNEGKADFKIFDAPTVNAIIDNQGLDHLKTIELATSEQPFIYFIFSQDQEELQAFVNKRLEELTADGTLSKIAKKYLGGDYVPAKQDLKLPTAKS
ncbi:amino acid ABC transporter substrate-binding protein [Streptococcus equi subsp. zooepidemicus]|uniref:amino acid ABC transporter substrate-binding protein n=1 Tax=Streptococcus equi TaxID=1336 RepID=UPI000DA3B787|nr:amino acid ABC transporter substrate-binding protein [Streptococcus equi]MCD3411387.1 amino acid ABC transporter substrate-binding protein [Streptococcus equi subsp. zooepidemicus]MCD3453609.1 amino acid ABC transporter substrate-binding protein [Streptococcus equi subsp. zooepidemicus]MDI6076544.1 amino acid ABC transporter substrate-binding protein [Streptococcus equi subsp. zooepidemicus]SQF82328.1 extracellular solute-binding protein [Streptococcus equi subsp. zooepidemicus]VTS36678.1 e